MITQPIEYGRESALAEVLINLSPPKCTPRQFVKNVLHIAVPDDPLTNIIRAMPHPSWLKIEEAARRGFGEEYVSAAVLSAVYKLRSINRRQPVKRDWSDLFHCHLCWRFAPGIGKYKRLCSVHAPATDQAEYKLAKRMEDEFRSQIRKIKRDRSTKRIPIPPTGQIRSYLKKFFPFVAENSKARTLRKLLVELDDAYDPVGTRAELHGFIVDDPEQALSFLLRCEAWHLAKESRVHGGRRKGAGRPRKNK